MNCWKWVGREKRSRAPRRGFGGYDRAEKIQTDSTGSGHCLRVLSPWKRGRPSCLAAIGWYSRAGDINLRPACSALNCAYRTCYDISVQLGRALRRRGSSLRGRHRDHGETVRRAPGPGNLGGLWGGEMALTKTWKPVSLDTYDWER